MGRPIEQPHAPGHLQTRYRFRHARGRQPEMTAGLGEGARIDDADEALQLSPNRSANKPARLMDQSWQNFAVDFPSERLGDHRSASGRFSSALRIADHERFPDAQPFFFGAPLCEVWAAFAESSRHIIDRPGISLSEANLAEHGFTRSIGE